MLTKLQVYVNFPVDDVINALLPKWEYSGLTFVKSVKEDFSSPVYLHSNKIIIYRCSEIPGLDGEIVLDLHPDAQNTMIYVHGDEYYARRFCEDISRWNYNHLPSPAETGGDDIPIAQAATQTGGAPEQAGGGAPRRTRSGRKPATADEIAAKKRLVELVEQIRPKCKNYEEAIPRAFEQLEESEQFWLVSIPAQSTVRSWRKKYLMSN